MLKLQATNTKPSLAVSCVITEFQPNVSQTVCASIIRADVINLDDGGILTLYTLL